jgi:hypothetical protein
VRASSGQKGTCCRTRAGADRTLANLTLATIARWRIVVPKLLATITIAAPVVVVSAMAQMNRLDERRFPEMAHLSGPAVITLSVLVVASIMLLSVRRLQRIDVPGD